MALGCPSPLNCLSRGRYDVELFQKIEALTGRKMEAYPAEQEAVLLLQERVADSQRIATMQVWRSLRGAWELGAQMWTAKAA